MAAVASSVVGRGHAAAVRYYGRTQIELSIFRVVSSSVSLCVFAYEKGRENLSENSFSLNQMYAYACARALRINDSSSS